jgi:hypothetical protein
MAIKVLFIDRDGTLIREPADQLVVALEKVELVRGVIPGLCTLRDPVGTGYRIPIESYQQWRDSTKVLSDEGPVGRSEDRTDERTDETR